MKCIFNLCTDGDEIGLLRDQEKIMRKSCAPRKIRIWSRRDFDYSQGGYRGGQIGCYVMAALAIGVPVAARIGGIDNGIPKYVEAAVVIYGVACLMLGIHQAYINSLLRGAISEDSVADKLDLSLLLMSQIKSSGKVTPKFEIDGVRFYDPRDFEEYTTLPDASHHRIGS